MVADGATGAKGCTSELVTWNQDNPSLDVQSLYPPPPHSRGNNVLVRCRGLLILQPSLSRCIYHTWNKGARVSFSTLVHPFVSKPCVKLGRFRSRGWIVILEFRFLFLFLWSIIICWKCRIWIGNLIILSYMWGFFNTYFQFSISFNINDNGIYSVLLENVRWRCFDFSPPDDSSLVSLSRKRFLIHVLLNTNLVLFHVQRINYQ